VDTLDRFDLNLLKALDVLLKERNVTHAAERLGLSQSATSATLARLRQAFDDQLLVREGRELALTPYARQLLPHLAEVIEAASRLMALRPRFDPATADRTFTIMTSDYAARITLHALLARVGTQAGSATVDIVALEDDFAERLHRGTIDALLIGEGIRVTDLSDAAHRPLFADRFGCAIWRHHPEVRGPATLEHLSSLPYLEYRPGGVVSAADRELDRLGVRRRVAARTESQTLVPYLLRGTPMITMLPERLAKTSGASADLRWSPSPVELRPIEQSVVWDPRRDDDLGLRWLIDQITGSPLP
jgi:DNA-binding transcriptional LysR family regulator